MLNRRIAGVVVAGLLLGAGAVNAAGSAFPSAANEFPLSLYTEMGRNATGPSKSGATGPVFPSAAIEHGPGNSAYEPARVRSAWSIAPSIAGNQSSPFPYSVNETGRL